MVAVVEVVVVVLVLVEVEVVVVVVVVVVIVAIIVVVVVVVVVVTFPHSLYCYMQITPNNTPAPTTPATPQARQAFRFLSDAPNYGWLCYEA